MTLKKRALHRASMAPLRFTVARFLSLIALPSVICLVLAFPGSVSAHTDLLRTAPTKDAILSTTPHQVSLWFSAAVEAEFSTAIVENEAYEYVDTRDAYLSPRDAREMDVPLPSHLAPGIYTVVWRAASQSDGLVLSGAYRFTLLQPGEIVPKQSTQLAWQFLRQEGVLAPLFPLLVILAAVWLLLLCLLRAAPAEDSGRSLVKRPVYQGIHGGIGVLQKAMEALLGASPALESVRGSSYLDLSLPWPGTGSAMHHFAHENDVTNNTSCATRRAFSTDSISR